MAIIGVQTKDLLRLRMDAIKCYKIVASLYWRGTALILAEQKCSTTCDIPLVVGYFCGCYALVGMSRKCQFKTVQVPRSARISAVCRTVSALVRVIAVLDALALVTQWIYSTTDHEDSSEDPKWHEELISWSLHFSRRNRKQDFLTTHNIHSTSSALNPED